MPGQSESDARALDEAKRELRRAMLERGKRPGASRALDAGRAVSGLVENAPEFVRASRVALYAALADELPTRFCFESVAASGRVALFPRIQPERRLSFHVIEHWESLVPGRHGVLEPPPDAPCEPLAGADLILVPGVAFDREGERLGRGAGYYDRALTARAPGSFCIGVSYEWQLVEAVPHGSRDVRMDAIVTEQGIYRSGAMEESQ